MHGVTPINHDARLLSSTTDLTSSLDAPKARHRIDVELKRRRILLFVLLSCDAVAAILLLLASVKFEFSHLLVRYTLSTALLDSLCITAIRVVALASQRNLAWWAGFACTTLAICKAIVFGYSGAEAAASAAVVAAALTSVLELFLCSRCLATMARRLALEKVFATANAEANAGGAAPDQSALEGKVEALLHPKTSSLRGTWKILRPYFFPAGWFSKMRTACTFLIMGGSKACNLMAPIFIGNAAQALADQNYPRIVKDLSIYCALRFGSSSLSELQKLVYIRVKQTAFAEIA